MVSNSVIIYLLENNSFKLSLFETSLKNLRDNFLLKFPYKVLLFHENNFPVREVELHFKNIYSNIEFKEISYFGPPRNIDAEKIKFEVGTHGGWMGMGYRNMCRFFSTIYLNYLTEYDYYWRLDTDSIVFEPMYFDPFEYMKKNNFLYGYIGDTGGPDAEKGGLFTHDYIKRNNITPQSWFNKIFFNDNPTLPERQIYNNFEIVNLNFLRQEKVLNYLKAVDQTGFIYKYKLGDAPIRTFTLGMFCPNNQIARFKNISYIHEAHFVQRLGAINSDYINKDWKNNDDWLGTTVIGA